MRPSPNFRRWAIPLAGVLLLAGCVDTGTTEPKLETGQFLELARTATCADQKNKLFVIDNKFVFHDRAGSCPDNSYSRTFYGVTPEAVLCREYDSIAGPQSGCADTGMRELFSTIAKNAEQIDLGLGSGHEVKVLNTATVPPNNFRRPDTDALKMTDIAGTTTLQFDEPAEIVVRDADKWSALWSAHQRPGEKLSPLPEIDFAKQMVIGVAAGQKPGPCNELLIDKIVHNGSMLVVNYTQRDVHEVCLTVVSGPVYPKHFVVIERQDVPVQFVKRDGDSGRVAFERIPVPGSAIAIEQALVVRDADSWAKLWAQANANMIPAPETPVVDFTKKMLIAVFMGTQPNGCYGVSIEAIDKVQEGLLVEVSKSTPGSGAICTQALTSPADVVAVERSDAKVIFESRRQRR